MKRLGSKENPATRFIVGLFLVAMLMIVITFVLMAVRLHAPASGRKTVVNGQTLLANYTVHFPIFHDQALDAIVGHYVKSEIDSFEATLAKKSDINNHLTLQYTVGHYGTRVAMVDFMRTERLVGKPDQYSTTRMMFDLVEKRQIGMQDIIQQTPEARMRLAKLLHDYLRQQPQLGLSPVELVGLLELQLDTPKSISLEANSLTLHINPRRPGSTQDTIAVAINKQLLDGILVDAYKANDPDNTAVVATQPDYHIVTEPPRGDAIDPSAKMLSLTFDDGPSDMTPRILDRLDTYEAHATFFTLGHLVSTYKATLQRMIREGNEIGNHSWNHPDLRMQSPAGLDHQIMGTEQAIQDATGGYVPTLMRPPYGFTNGAVHQYLADHHLMQALWNVDTGDWRDRNAQLIYDRIMGSARDGRVILLHDIHPTSVEAALRAIRDLKAEGYQLVTLSQLYQYRQ